MCGINGIVSLHPNGPPVDVEELTRTREAMRTRGPDAAGLWISNDRRVGLGHRRLSIIDVSERANQPLIGREGDVALTFNGEIYNFRELRAELEQSGEQFSTTADIDALPCAGSVWHQASVLRSRQQDLSLRIPGKSDSGWAGRLHEP